MDESQLKIVSIRPPSFASSFSTYLEKKIKALHVRLKSTHCSSDILEGWQTPVLELCLLDMLRPTSKISSLADADNKEQRGYEPTYARATVALFRMLYMANKVQTLIVARGSSSITSEKKRRLTS